MNIGIITMYYKNYNYGGQLQAYALCKALEKEKISAKQILFDPYSRNLWDKCVDRIRHNAANGVSVNSLKRTFDNWKKRKKERWQYMNILPQDNAIDKFNAFMEEIPHTEYVNTRTIKKLSNVFDRVILGGDQIWNPQYFNPRYYGDWVDSKIPVNAYSVSASDSFSTHEKRRLFKLIKQIDSIAVREEALLNIIKKEYKGKKKIACVLDPVFLYSRQEWEDIAIDYNVNEPYIFAYFLSKDNDFRNIVEDFAQLNKLKLVTIPHARGTYNECDENFGDVQVFDAGPREFLSLIKNAKIVCTDSFHGTCFSIIFHKEFFCFENNKYQESKTNQRIKNLLNKAGLEEKLIVIDKENRIKREKNINYFHVDRLLQEEIKKSKKWLSDIIKDQE